MNQAPARTRRRHAITGSLLALLAAALAPIEADAQDTAIVRQTPAGILVDFQDVDLRAVISALAEAGQFNVSFGELPARRVTLRLRQPVARGDILPLLRSLAQSYGLRVIDAGPVVRIEATDPREAAAAAAQGGGPQQGQQQAELRLFVHRLRHARAARMASTLQAIFGGRGPTPQGAPGLGGRPLSEQLRGQQLPPTNPADTTRQVAVTIEQPGVLATASIPGALRGEVQIVPDETTNSLLIRAQQADYDVIRQAVDAMDLRPLQVLIEVLIAEVRRSRELDVGISGTARGTKGGTKVDAGLAGSEASTGDFLLKITRDGKIDVELAIDALSSRGDVRILSRPVILAQNNQEAKILVGSQRPFVQVFRSLPTDAAVRDQVVQYRDVGTSLSILPTINPDGYVSLQISQEVSSATAETQFGAPVISTREASTHLFVRDGQTAVLGGLVDHQRERTRSGIPGLVDIPGIGVLFGSTRHTTTNSELFLFLTPHIVQTDTDADRIREGVEQRSDRLRRALPENPNVVPARPTPTPAPPPR